MRASSCTLSTPCSSPYPSIGPRTTLETHSLSQIATACLNVLAEEGAADIGSYGSHCGVFAGVAGDPPEYQCARGSSSAAES